MSRQGRQLTQNLAVRVTCLSLFTWINEHFCPLGPVQATVSSPLTSFSFLTEFAAFRQAFE